MRMRFSATGKAGGALMFEDSDSFLMRFKVVNDSAGHLTVTVKEAAGLMEKTGEMYCNLDVKYKKSEISLTTNVVPIPMRSHMQSFERIIANLLRRY